MRAVDLAFVELVQRQLRDVRWAEPAELRATGSRRRRRATAAAAARVVVVVGGSTAALAGVARGPAVTSAPASASGPAEIPVEALLSGTDPAVRDVRADTDMELGDSGLQEPVQVDGSLDACAREHGEPVRTVVSRYSRSRSLFGHRWPGQPDSIYPVLAQDIYRLTPGGAAAVLDDLERHVSVCASWDQAVPRILKGEVSGTQQLVQRWRVTDRNLANCRTRTRPPALHRRPAVAQRIGGDQRAHRQAGPTRRRADRRPGG